MPIGNRHQSCSEQDEARRRHGRQRERKSDDLQERNREVPRSTSHNLHPVFSASDARTTAHVSPSHYTQNHDYTMETRFDVGEYDEEYIIEPCYGVEAYDWEYSTPSITTYHARASSRILPIKLNGHLLKVCADSGSGHNLISAEYAAKLGADITRETTPTVFKLPLKGMVFKAIGWTEIECDFPESNLPPICDEDRFQRFYVLKSLTRDIILGRYFLHATKTLTEYSDRLESIKHSPKYTNSVQISSQTSDMQGSEHMQCWVNGVQMDHALPDTGSDFNLISTKFATQLGYTKYDRKQSAQLTFADHTETWSLGTIQLVVSFSEPKEGNHGSIYNFVADERSSAAPRRIPKLDERDSFRESFHVVDGLAWNLLLGQTFLYSIDAYNNFQQISIPGPEDMTVGGIKNWWSRREQVRRHDVTISERFTEIYQGDFVERKRRGSRWYDKYADREQYTHCSNFTDIWPHRNSREITNRKLYERCYHERCPY